MTRAEIERKERELRDRIEELYEEIDRLPEPEDGPKPRASDDEFSAAIRAIHSLKEVKAQLNRQADIFKWFKEKK